MGELLAAFATGGLGVAPELGIAPEWTTWLWDCLQLNQLSYSRIVKYLPPGITAAHKGGTLGDIDYGITNDVAMLWVPVEGVHMQSEPMEAGEPMESGTSNVFPVPPDSRHPVVLVIMTRGNGNSRVQREDCIARVARGVVERVQAQGV